MILCIFLYFLAGCATAIYAHDQYGDDLPTSTIAWIIAAWPAAIWEMTR